jgi:hypothetical protein
LLHHFAVQASLLVSNDILELEKYLLFRLSSFPCLLRGARRKSRETQGLIALSRMIKDGSRSRN